MNIVHASNFMSSAPSKAWANTESEYVPPYGLWPRSEFEWRWTRAHNLMSEHGFDALIVSYPENIHYLTGSFFPPGWVRRGVVILPKDGEPILLVMNHQVDRVRPGVFVKDIRGHALQMDAPSALAPAITEILTELRVQNGTIGAEMTAPYTMGLIYDEFEATKARLPNARFTSCSELIASLRVIKSKREIEAVRRACQITDKGHEAIPQIVRKGMNQREVGDALELELERWGGFSPFVYVRDGTDKVGTMGSYKGFKEVNADRPVPEGYLVVDLGCSYKYYWSDFSRHYWIGEPPDKARRYAKLSVKAVDKALEMAAPGVKSGDIIKAIYTVLREGGLSEEQVRIGVIGLIGHAIGLDMVDMVFASNTQVPFQEGMTTTIEPTFMSEYGWWVPEVDIVITKDGNELLSSYPKDLVQI